MNQNNYYCKEHPNYQIGGFYKSNLNTKSQRKLCIECILTRKIQPEQIISKDNFVQQLSKKFNQISTVLQQGQNDYSKILLKLDSVQEGIIKIFSCIKEFVNDISEVQRLEDDRFLNIIKNNLNPLECSATELDELMTLLEGSIFEDYDKRKKIAFSRLDREINSLDKSLLLVQQKRELIQQMMNQFTEVKREQNMITLKGFQKSKSKLAQTTFNLVISRQGDQVYQKDGQILRIQKKEQLSSKDQQILNNLEQMKHLEFKGKYGADGQKINQWNYFWKGEKIGGGIYSQIGQKQGRWQNLCDNYWDKQNVIQEGQYKDGKQIGTWNFIWNNQYIGGGQFDNQGSGRKNGYWVELLDGYNPGSQYIINGYYKNGKKIGRWDIMCRGKQIGYGSYDCKQDGDSIKLGKWIELIYGVHDDSQITYVGEYLNGKKVGQWDIWYQENYDNKENLQIGGGVYEHQEDGDSIKIGKWIELNDGFYYNSQVTHVGEYLNGKKFGNWDIMYKGQSIGGGSYECQLEGDSIKIGNWIELSTGFNDNSQVTYVGQYSDGSKFGKWDIYYKFYLFQWRNKKIGGGLYEENLEGDSVKVGQWIEQSEVFNWNAYIIYIGEYKNGKKVGKWRIWFRYYFEKCGGGSYEDILEGDSVKVGQWVEQSEGFQETSQTIIQGDYKNGRKVGIWKVTLDEEIIGSGCYDNENFMKIGNWVELSDRFYIYSQVTYQGLYKNCQKVGKWEILFEGIEVGGGFYDDQGSFKIGEWIELSDKFDYQSQVTYKGQYKNNKKVGSWVILWNWKDINQQIGNGLYDDQVEGDSSIKVGSWIEQSDDFDRWSQIVNKGEYKNGRKIGKWVEINIKQNIICGELNYDN
ncbi:unnamed protein product [Paramecium pentaurelia]|uniref:Uncharacterized protein n=1 Tax=Paramecium pentaurelia TaxID=43138 RepID=A0A8S1WPA4_9CILI|nr:unnamed protein product [Paramecium pentaurelia]